MKSPSTSTASQSQPVCRQKRLSRASAFLPIRLLRSSPNRHRALSRSLPSLLRRAFVASTRLHSMIHGSTPEITSNLERHRAEQRTLEVIWPALSFVADGAFSATVGGG